MKRAICSVVVVVVVAGCGVPEEPGVQLSLVGCDEPCVIDFADVAVGGDKTKTLEVRNDGATTVESWAGVGDETDAAFSLSAPAALAASATGTLSVTFAPTTDGGATGELLVASLSTPIALAGRGVCPLTFSATACDFGDVDIGADAFCTIDVSADGCDGVVANADVNGGGVFFFDSALALPLSLPDGDSVALRLRATPTTDGVSIGTFVVNETTITLRVES